ncbi:hypothetical protein F5Y08DRAFT_346688 [Xylaria arbuscula]|nr:hypothetical protein F5Y08DRAFT_346688 [Xylaria arbuscula]
MPLGTTHPTLYPVGRGGRYSQLWGGWALRSDSWSQLCVVERTKQLSTIPFDNDIATELQRPAAVLEAYGLSIDHVAILDHHIDRHVNGWADHDALCANVARAARELQHQVQQRQVNMPRLYAEFIAAFLTQRQQLEMVFVHTRVALRKHRVPDAA